MRRRTRGLIWEGGSTAARLNCDGSRTVVVLRGFLSCGMPARATADETIFVAMKAVTRAVLVFWLLAIIGVAVGVGLAINAPAWLIVALAVGGASGYTFLVIRDKRTCVYLWRSDAEG
jgi:hypothetical protein